MAEEDIVRGLRAEALVLDDLSHSPSFQDHLRLLFSGFALHFNEAADALESLRASLTRVEEERDEAYEDAAGIAEEGAYYGGNRTDAEGLARDIASAIRHKGRDLKAQDDARLSRASATETERSE